MNKRDQDRARLVVVFNHRYDDNIPRLEAMYRNAFPDAIYVVPFYDGPRDDVIPVWSSSHNFQGFFAQALPALKKEDCTHYAFVGDDLIINPRLDTSSLISSLKLGPGTGYIKELHSLADVTFSWMHIWRALRPWLVDSGVEWQSELPDWTTARRLLQRHGLQSDAFTWRSLRGFQGRGLRPETLRGAAHLLRGGGRRRLPYPLAMGYSDFIIVPASSLEIFSRYCGIFAAMGVFVEAAAPTALALACDEIRTEAEVPLRGRELWGTQDIQAFADLHHHDLSRLLEDFPEDTLYVHPVKLSKWEGAVR